ncbi:MAG TPA: hypothetical protein VGQ96_06080 [Candidatus Eremiobacteraceae bacterium]|nr:hypothetical protein [Candidatus Eremiobacteraceae bacterium]
MRDIKGANGFIVARVDSSGNITLGSEGGPIVGLATNAGEIFDDEAGVHQVGRVDGEGTVFTMQHEVLGKVDSWGRVYDRSGSLAGKVEKPVDGGVLLLIAEPAQVSSTTEQSPDQGSALMQEALELGDEQRTPKVRKDYKPLTDRDLFMEHLRRDSDK